MNLQKLCASAFYSMKRQDVKEALLAYLFLLPSLIVLGIFTFWPIGFSFVLSFFKWDFRNMTSPYFHGLKNYAEILKFDYPPKFPFYYGLIYSILYMVLSFLVILTLMGFFKIKDKRSALSAVSGTALLVLYGLIHNFLNLYSAIIFSLFGILVIVLSSNTKAMQMLKMHGWLDFVIFVVSFVLFEFKFTAGFDKNIYGIINFLLDAGEKNLLFKALVNTTYYVILTVPIGLSLALLMALLLNSNIKFRAFFRTAFFIPFVTSAVAVGLIWKWIYNDDIGLLNYLLSFLGLDPVKWLKDAKWTIPTVSIVSIWHNVGYNATIFLAGLQNIDTFYYEAADVDGASNLQKFLYITWPLLTPTTFFLTIVSVIGAFKVFQQVFILYDGLPGPYGNSGMTMVYYVFDMFYRQQRMGIASAAAYLLFIIILVFTFIQYRVGDKVVEYVG